MRRLPIRHRLVVPGERVAGGGVARIGLGRSALLLLALILLTSSRARGEEPGERGSHGDHAYRSHFEIELGLVRGLEGDSAETHFSFGVSARANVRPRLSLGLECGAQDLHDGERSTSFGVVHLTAFAEVRLARAGRVLPFVAGGVGLYSWRWCRGTAGDDFYLCSTLFPDRRTESIGGWVGAGVHTGLAGSRSIAAAGQIHPYSSSGGGWPFLRLYLAFGF